MDTVTQAGRVVTIAANNGGTTLASDGPGRTGAGWPRACGRASVAAHDGDGGVRQAVEVARWVADVRRQRSLGPGARALQGSGAP